MRSVIRPFTYFVLTVREQFADPTFRGAAGILAALFLLSTVFHTVVEGWSPLDSLYFSVIAASTVGFGDFAPQTEIGKAFTIFFVLIGVGLLVLLGSRVASGMVATRVAHAQEAAQRRKGEGRSRRRRRRSEGRDATSSSGPAVPGGVDGDDRGSAGG